MSLLDEQLKVHDAKSVRRVLAAIERAERRGLVAPGIADEEARIVFAKQIIESIRRIQFVTGIRARDIGASRADPQSTKFDPIRAAAVLSTQGSTEEAPWLVFLATHFGQRPETGWNLARTFYAGDQHGPWTWQRASADVPGMKAWLEANKDALRSAGRFGNHRQYESLDAYSQNGTGTTLASYIDWVLGFGSHDALFRHADEVAQHDRGVAFSVIYEDMAKVRRFGRLAKFDHLCMLGKLGIANIWPQSMYIASSTGPKRGGKMMFGSAVTSAQMEAAARLLDSEMQVGMQVLEDALCNWQKNPETFIRFRG